MTLGGRALLLGEQDGRMAVAGEAYGPEGLRGDSCAESQERGATRGCRLRRKSTRPILEGILL